MSEKKKLKWWHLLCIILSSLILLVAIVLLGARLYFRLSVNKYYKASEKGFEIPGLREGFVPQGMHYDERSNCFFITGYMNDGSASPVYLVDNSNGDTVKTVRLLTKNGDIFDGHAGGIAVNGSYVYIAGGADYCLYVYSYFDIVNAEDKSEVKCLGAFSTGTEDDGIRVSFVTADSGKLYVGEFHDGEKYKTPDSHKLITKNGDKHSALCVVYEFSDSEEAILGIDNTPKFAYSLPDKVQGMCFRNGEIYLSTSYGVAFSHIYAYNEDKLIQQDDISIMGESLSLYALDSASLINDMKIAPMSEEIVFVNGKLYTMCESASNKYIFGKFTSAKWCYATDVSKY